MDFSTFVELCNTKVYPGHEIDGYAYRYVGQDRCIYCEYHRVIRNTAKGFWIDNYGEEKFVFENSRKKYACKTIKAAEESFIARKIRQIKILSTQLEIAKIHLQDFEEFLTKKEK